MQSEFGWLFLFGVLCVEDCLWLSVSEYTLVWPEPVSSELLRLSIACSSSIELDLFCGQVCNEATALLYFYFF